jgi:hypothetical protein
LADIAAWADSYRQEHPETAGWHFVDIPAGQAKFDRQLDCPASSTDPKSRGEIASQIASSTSKAGSATPRCLRANVLSR